jgi:hypothetical protein
MPPADLSRIYFGYLLLIVQLFIKLKGNKNTDNRARHADFEGRAPEPASLMPSPRT